MTQSLDERVRQCLARRADAVDPSFDGWTAISRRIERRQWRTRTVGMSLAAGLSFAAVALVVVMATVSPESPDQNVAATGGSNPALGPTTTYAPATQGTPTTVVEGQGSSTSTVPGEVPVAPGTNAGATGPGSKQPGPDATTTGYIPAAIWPETLAELQRLQAGGAEGHQPWRDDPQQVAFNYLADRGVPNAQAATRLVPMPADGIVAFRYTSGGVDGWVHLTQLDDGSIFFVESARSDRIRQLEVVRQGDRMSVAVTALAPGAFSVRTKRPGMEWSASVTQPAAAGRQAWLTVDDQASTDMILQVLHRGDDGTVALSEHYLRSLTNVLSYEALHDGSTIDFGRLGDINIGNSLDGVEKAAGIPMRLVRTEHCATMSPVGSPEGVAFVSVGEGDAVDVFLVDAPGVRTPAGIGVGSTVAEVRQAYPGIEERLTDGHGLLIHRSGPDDTTPLEMLFKVRDGKVISIWSGMIGISNTDELCA